MNTRALPRDRQELDSFGSLSPDDREFFEFVLSASDLGLTLPEAFLQFMSSRMLLDLFFSANDSALPALPETIVPYPGQGGGYLIRFLTDQQDCLFWYLYLNPTTQGQCVLVSDYWFDLEEDYKESFHSDPSRNGEILLCAPTFEMFLYRYWLESILSEKLESNPPAPLTSEEQRYLEHYKHQNE
jgi:hypothetical protein